MGIPTPGFHSRAHAWGKRCFALIGDEYRATFQNIDEFILFGMRMAKGGATTRCKASEIDAEIGQAKQIAKRSFFPARHTGGKGLRIIRRFGARRCVQGDDGDRYFWIGHGESKEE